jgi:hypothetical protein
MDAYLASVPTEKLRSVLREPMPDFANDPSFIAIVRERFGFSEAEIRQLGFGEALIRKIEASFTPAELEKIKEKNPDALDKMWREKLTERNWFLASLLYLPETGQRALSGMTLEEIKRLSRGLRDFAEGSRVMDMLKYPHFLIHEGYKNFTLDRANGGIGKPVPGHKPAVLSLLTELAERQPRGLAFADWMEIYRDLDRAEGIAPTALPTKLRASLADFFEKNLSQMPLAEQLKVLSRPSFLALLSSEKQGEYLARIYLSLVPPGATLAEKSRILEALQARVRLKDVSPEASRRLKLTVAEKLNLQPQEIKAFFPHEKFTPQDYSLHIRGASGIVSQVQTLPLEEQIYFIEYMLGREDKAPASIEKMAKDVREKVGSRIDFADMVIQVRARLMNESTMGRALAILPFYTGVNSILGHKGATDVLLDKILTGVSEQHRGLARELAHGIIASEGKNAPMAFAMIFAQGKSGVPLTEGEILRGLFSAYGVPGVKFAQYLAFTSEFKAVSEALASLQDQAMPLTYLEIVELLEKKFPDGLPDGLRVLGVKGSGSVNIGLEIFNPISGENEILSVPRENIRTATNQDFGRIRELIRRLTMTPEGKARYGFAVGLDRVIQKSVELEFNRPQVFENQKELSKIYNRKVDGWNIRMVAPYALEQDTIRMQKAQGVPARLVETDKPEVYRKAMKAASTVMMDHLLQKDGTSRHFADSDFHNGQAFIDEKTKTVWLIDPGQAIEINRKEFDLAKTILRLFSGTADEQNAIYELNTSILNPASRQNVQLVTKLEIAEIMKSGDIGDAFIKFVALVERKGGDMPLPIVQWILGMNRQLALGKKIGLNNEARLLLSFSQDTAQKLLRGGRGCGEDFAAIFRSLKDRLVPQR